MSSLIPAAVIPQRVSLVAQTVNSLRAHLAGGQWQRLPAERELARLLQISRPTLRAALLKLQDEGVIQLAGRTRRCAGSSARRAKGSIKTQKTISLLGPWPLQAMNPTSLLLLDTLREKLSSAGFAVEHHVVPACFSPRPSRSIENIVRGKPASLWIAWGSKEPMQRWFLQQRLPLLVVGSSAPGMGLTSVDADFRATCRHAGDLLWRKGHRRIALVVPQDAYDGDIESERGLRESMSTHEGALLRVLRHNGTASHICTLVDETLRSPAPPTGYLVVRAVHALTVTMHLLRRKLRLPQDAAVVSRDDEVYLRHTSPELSRYSINPEYFASRVFKAVRELADTGTMRGRAIRLMPRFVPGETV